jgi:phosphoribosylanthranilate isomerase
MFVKVCGLKTKEQIDQAIECGYDAIGIVTYSQSKRYLAPDAAIELAEYAKGKILRFIVGLNYSDVEKAALAFDYIQIYENKKLPNLVLASKDMPPDDLKYEYFVYDASIGSGIYKGFPEWLKHRSDKLIVAGGLNQANVCKVIQEIHPFGIDVSSGVEKDGVKDLAMMKEFIDTVKHCTGRKGAGGLV